MSAFVQAAGGGVLLENSRQWGSMWECGCVMWIHLRSSNMGSYGIYSIKIVVYYNFDLLAVDLAIVPSYSKVFGL